MAVHWIQLEQSNPDYIAGVQLVDTQYNLHVYWNDRDQAWMLDMLDSGENLIAANIKIVVRWQLGRTVQDPPFTTGVLMALDSSGSDLDPGFDDLGGTGRVQLYYYPTQDWIQFLDFASGITYATD